MSICCTQSRAGQLRIRCLGGTITLGIMLSCLSFALSAWAQTSGRGDWWMFHHDPQHSGRSPFTGPAAPQLKWKTATGDMIDSSPAIGADGTIYFGSDDDNVYALNATDGSVKWKLPTGNDVLSSPAIGADGTIYVGDADGFLYALNPADGSLKWKYIIGSIVCSPAIGADGTIYIGSDDNIFYAINPAGTLKWSFTTGYLITYSSPAIAADGTIYFGSYDFNCYALNPANGAMKWQYTTGNNIGSAPAIGADGTIYIGSGDGNLYALNPADGTLKWQYAGNGAGHPAIAADGTIYFGSGDGNVYALNPGNGSLKWKYTTKGNVSSSAPAIDANGTIYVGSWDDNLYALNPADGSLKWKYTTGNQIFDSPAIGADGTIYFGSRDGYLYAIQPTSSATFTITPSAGEHGAITPCRTQIVKSGASLTFIASPACGYMVNSWLLDSNIAQTGGTTFALPNITANHTVRVTFKVAMFTISPTAGTHGTLKPDTVQTVYSGQCLTFTAAPACGYMVQCWSVDGKVAQTFGRQFTLKNIIDNHAVKVTFVKACIVRIWAGPHGDIDNDGEQMVSWGSTLVLTAKPARGYTVDLWWVDGVSQQSGGTKFTLSDITANHEVRVTFTRKQRHDSDNDE